MNNMAQSQNQQNPQTPIGTRKISTYLTIIIVIVLALSIIALLIAGGVYFTTPSNWVVAVLFAFIGLIALTMSLFTLYQSQRQAKEMKIETPKVMTIVGCVNQSCDNKTSREFQRGDYVYKELEAPCTKCQSKQMIVGIYKEVKEKEKTYNV
jgi:hypothetical protein